MITRMKRFNWTADTRRTVIRLLWFPAALFWLECVVRLACYGSLVENSLLYPALFCPVLGPAERIPLLHLESEGKPTGLHVASGPGDGLVHGADSLL